MHSSIKGLITIVLCLAVNQTLRAANAAFRLEANWKLGGNGSWDYMAIDPTAHFTSPKQIRSAGLTIGDCPALHTIGPHVSQLRRIASLDADWCQGK